MQVSLRLAEGRWRVEVSDEGPGVPEDAREAVFEPFHRLDQRLAGAGLGLAIVREVAEAHAGAAWAEGGPQGARFVLEAPA